MRQRMIEREGERESERDGQRERRESRIDRVARGWSNRRPTGWSAFHASPPRIAGKGVERENGEGEKGDHAHGPSTR